MSDNPQKNIALPIDTIFDHSSFLKSVSEQAGVYRMYDHQNVIIYVGKAKNLKKDYRVIFEKMLEAIKPKRL